MGRLEVIVLDTHVLVWWTDGGSRLSRAAATAIRDEQRQDGRLLVSAISLWEIALLIEKGRMALAVELDEWLESVEAIEGLIIVAISARMAVHSVRLPGEFHADPADRMIVALAREVNAPLITADRKVHSYSHVKSIW